jgi:FixJ family two-component response regulator
MYMNAKRQNRYGTSEAREPGAPTVFVIDPDPTTRDAIRELALTMNLRCQAFASGREFFAAYTDSAPGCLVLEVRIPDMSGLQIQRRLADLGMPLPLVFLSAHNDVSLAVELMRGGAVHHLQKPFRPLEMMHAIQEALARGQARRKAQQRHQRVLEGIAVLTAKEREVLRLIGEGMRNREIASRLGISLRTVELRRKGVTKKLRLKSPTALLQFALLANRNGKAYLAPSLNERGGASR